MAIINVTLCTNISHRCIYPYFNSMIQSLSKTKEKKTKIKQMQ